MQLELLQETTDEMARNGCKKIIVVNGHGGNAHFLPFFAQAQLAAPHDYVVYIYQPTRSGKEFSGRPPPIRKWTLMRVNPKRHTL